MSTFIGRGLGAQNEGCQEDDVLRGSSVWRLVEKRRMLGNNVNLSQYDGFCQNQRVRSWSIEL